MKMMAIVCCLLLSLYVQASVGFRSPAITVSIPNSEFMSLSDLYYGTHGSSWSWNLSTSSGAKWNFTDGSDPCSDNWQGLTCSSNTSLGVHVTALILPLYNLNGRIPTSIGNLTQLLTLDLSTNSLKGTIPSFIGNMASLQVMQLSNNKWTGSIPDTIGALLGLKTFDVSGIVLDAHELQVLIQNDPLHIGEGLTGTIPTNFANLISLTYFSIGYNAIGGPLDPLGHMPLLEYMFIYLNRFSGALPNSFSKFLRLKEVSLGSNALTGYAFSIVENNVNLTQFVVGINQFNGTIPAVLGQRAKMVNLDMSYNNFSGPLPPGLFDLTQLELFNVANNSLTGAIPSDVHKLVHIMYFDVSHNHFGSTLPNLIGEWKMLQFLDVSQNHFTGTIPNEFGNLTGVFHFDLGANKLRGTIPTSLGNFHRAYLFDLSSNNFVGSIPNALSRLLAAQFFNLSANRLQGSIPMTLLSQPSLTTIDLSDNALTGCIPALLGSSKSKLQALYLHNNFLTGSISQSFSGATHLQTLLLQNNSLSGQISGVFNASTQANLSLVQLSSNQLTGSLPDVIFRLPKLQTLLAVQNCFVGSIPVSVCNSSSLVTLALDGLQSASHCRVNILPAFSKNSYLPQNTLMGGIPSCVFELSNLRSLHLSGNGLTGSLPQHVVLRPQLTSLSLSNNFLTGTIPSQFQIKSWDLFDLSFNRITGELSSLFAPPTASTLFLQNNRLSGFLPGAIVRAADVSVLKGNLFDCSLDGRQLPDGDRDKKHYSCASTAFDGPFYLWLTAVAVVGMVAVALWQRRGYFEEHFQLIATANKLREYFDFPAAVHHTEDVYRSSNDSSYSSQSSGSMRSLYERLRSVRYICGILVMICSNTVVSALLVLFVLLIYFPVVNTFYRTHTHTYTYQASAAYVSGEVPFVVEFVLFSVFVVVVLVLYWISLNRFARHQSRRDRKNEKIEPSQVRYFSAESLQKLPTYCVYFTINFVVVLGVNILFVYVTLRGSYRLIIFCQMLISGFKIAWNHCLTFYSTKFFAEKNLTGEEQQLNVSRVFCMQLFVLLMNNIAIPCFVVMTISPSCFYDIFTDQEPNTSSFVYEQCTGIILESGCDLYVNTTSITSYQPPFTYSYQCSSSIVKNYAPAFMYMCLTSTFAIPAARYLLLWLQINRPDGRVLGALNRFVQYPVLKARDSDCSNASTTSIGDVAASATQQAARSINRTYFNANQLILTELTYVGMFMTFGVVFPPLAAAFAVTICVTTIFARLRLGYFLYKCYTLGLWEYIDKINIDCTRVVSLNMLQDSVWILIFFACSFYTIFLFDTLGDVVGYKRAYWVLIAVPLMPVSLYLICTAVAWYTATPDAGPPRVESSRGIVMNPLSLSLNKSIEEEPEVVATA